MKRPCPFESCIHLQLKTHVGEKEVNNGVQRETKLKEIHARTLRKLIDGARRHDNSIQFPPVVTTASDNSAGLRQMSIDARGGISLAPGDQVDVNRSRVQLASCCQRCGVSVLTAAVSEAVTDSHVCQYCERRPLCASCIRLCSACGLIFCCDHCFDCYTSDDNSAVCLSCHH